MLREFLGREVLTPGATLLGIEDAPFRVNLVGSPIVGLVMTRYVLGVEPLASMPPSAVVATIAPTLQRYLAEPLDQNEVTGPAPRRDSRGTTA